MQVGFNVGLSSKTWSKGIALLGTMRMQQVRLDEFGSSSLMAQAGSFGCFGCFAI
jgi:hypothetical protein